MNFVNSQSNLCYKCKYSHAFKPFLICEKHKKYVECFECCGAFEKDEELIHRKKELEKKDVMMMFKDAKKFIKDKNGFWDAPNCHECCSDCSACEEDCECPLDLGEEDCSNCVFRNGYKKCGECYTNSRTENEKYIQMGYWWMCDECITKWTK